jgi:hypothetical protein
MIVSLANVTPDLLRTATLLKLSQYPGAAPDQQA